MTVDHVHMRFSLTGLRALLASAVLASSSACLPCCGDTQAGDANAMATLEPLFFTSHSTWRLMADDSNFPTIVGGQGFTMLVVGPRATNVDTCGVTIQATLMDLESMQSVGDAELERNLTRVDETTAETSGLQREQWRPGGAAFSARPLWSAVCATGREADGPQRQDGHRVPDGNVRRPAVNWRVP